MTWGSNPSFDKIPCRYCGREMVDDTSEGDSSHEKVCPQRSWFSRRRFVGWVAAAIAAVPVLTREAAAALVVPRRVPELIFTDLRVTEVFYGMLVAHPVTHKFGFDRTAVRITMRNYRDQEYSFETEDADVIREMRECLEEQCPLTLHMMREPAE